MTSQVGAVWESQIGVASGTPTYGTYGTNGESGCERGNLMSGNARASKDPISTGHCESCKCSPTLDRLLRRLDRSGGPDSCWTWTGYRNPSGYGLTHAPIGGRKKTVIAHRAVYQLTTGRTLTSDVHLLHQCDNPPCCNPAHLREGDHLQNMADRKNRGAGYPTGLDNHRAIDVPPEIVEAIRAEYRWHVPGRGAPSLAAKYGMSRTLVDHIARRKGRWAE